jgi:hypothetical protein
MQKSYRTTRTLREPKLLSVSSFIADGTGLEDDRHGAGLGSSDVRIDEFVATAFGASTSV